MGWEVSASGIGRKWKRDMGDLISLRPITLPVLCPRFDQVQVFRMRGTCPDRLARDRQLRFQLDSGREHPPRDMSSSQTGHCYGEIDETTLLSS